MQVSEAVSLLGQSELKQLAVKDSAPDVLGFINLGILELHKRFPLWQNEAVITLADGKSTYVLDGVDTDVSIDLSDNELLVIESVYDEDGIPLVLNNNKEKVRHLVSVEVNTRVKIQTPKYNTLKVTNITPGYTLEAVYRATPKFLTEQDDEIQLPPQFFEALFLYAAYRAHISVKAGLKEENNTYFIRFEEACKRIDDEGLFPQQGMESNKFEQRGFV